MNLYDISYIIVNDIIDRANIDMSLLWLAQVLGGLEKMSRVRSQGLPPYESKVFNMALEKMML